MSDYDEIHWAENFCDLCGKRIHPNAGALCLGCALDFRLEVDPWMKPGLVAETPDSVFDAEEKETVLNRGRRLARERRAAG